MISDQPKHIQLPTREFNPLRSLAPSPSPSDISTHRAGDVPPALSPLDAFAQQSRLLARKFEEESERGKRISRLPHLTVAKEFAGSRPGYFRSVSEESVAPNGTVKPSEKREETAKSRVAEDIQQFSESAPRPKSQYPILQVLPDNLSRTHHNFSPVTSTPVRHAYPSMPSKQFINTSVTAAQDFAFPQTNSPEPLSASRHAERFPDTRYGAYASGNTSRTGSPGHLRIRNETPNESPRLGPSRSPAPSRSPWGASSIRSVPPEGSFVPDGPSMTGSCDSIQSNNRYLGGSISTNSPISPLPPHIPRPPSAASSQYSIGSRQPRPSLNFSRPRGSAGSRSIDTRPSFEHRPSTDNYPAEEFPLRKGSGRSESTASFADALSRQNSDDGLLPTPVSHDLANSPNSAASEDYFTNRGQQGQASTSSYIYRKYSLPRDRQVDRASVPASEFLTKQFNVAESESYRIQAQTRNIQARRPPSPPASPRTVQLPRPGLLIPGMESAQRSRSTGLLEPLERSSTDRTTKSPSLSNQSSGPNDVKTKAFKSRPSTAELSAQTHLDRGIELHEQGALQESTYHLRLAARAGEPTGMLLYALACRHGWGMRPNQAEGVSWLRKAVDVIGLDVSDDAAVDPFGTGAGAVAADPKAALNLPDRKARKAQFALGIYELGVSYMNGWGIAQDRALAVRCFEVAGSWGDGDALAEAGYCYTEGLGCKKDLHKAARLYRLAAQKGISMTGNSW